MNYWDITLEDLAGNAFIELGSQNPSIRRVSLAQLIAFGEAIVNALRASGYLAFLILTREARSDFVSEYSDFFRIEAAKEGGEEYVELLDGKDVADLRATFRRGYTQHMADAICARDSQAALERMLASKVAC